MKRASKSKLTAVLSDSQERTLLTEIELGARKPSHLLREMRALAGKKINEEVLKTLWLQRMPTNV